MDIDDKGMVLQALQLPSLDGLTEDQVRGAACVWCNVPLPVDAVDLGPQRKKRLDGEYNWFPRGCPKCVGEQAFIALFDHAQTGVCVTCESRSDCPFAVEVRRLMREGWRWSAPATATQEGGR
ncbi:hypothetical protein [Streptomyces bullii]|uniref:Uncharacterized protein n=1 Tax=Streptomyces bullii TaxID=349910 RepID=A0ABW0UMJ0_9ACTN